jgi:hypothetical protein
MLAMAEVLHATPASEGTSEVRLRLKKDRRLTSVVELAAGVLAGDAIAAIAHRLESSPAATTGAVASTLLLVVGELAAKACDGTSEALAGAFADTHGDGFLHGVPATLLDPRTAAAGQLASTRLFGGDLPAAAQVLTRATGVPLTHAVALLGLVTSVSLGVLGRLRRQQWLEPAEVGDLLARQRFHRTPVADLAASVRRDDAGIDPPSDPMQALIEYLQRKPS